MQIVWHFKLGNLNLLVELREPVLALGLGIVSSVGHDCHHDTQRRDDEIQLKGLLGLLQLYLTIQ